MKKIIFISYHYFKSQRKAGFHWLAEAFAKKDSWEVLFVTAPICLFSKIGGDHRFSYPVISERNRIVQVTNKISSYVYMTWLIPFSFRSQLLSQVMKPVTTLLSHFYGKFMPSALRKEIIHSDIIVFESTVALLLYGKICELNPSAKKIYRVSDDLELLHSPQYVLNYEKEIAPKFDLISAPSEYIYNKFSLFSNSRLHYHGINKELFKRDWCIPEYYRSFDKNFVFVGISYFDREFIQIAAELFPRWGFHVIGPQKEDKPKKNAIYYGEMPFIDTIPFILYADAGLQTLKDGSTLASLSDSLKILQYTYCKLPILAPEGLGSTRPNIIYYVPGDEDSIKNALQRVAEYERTIIDTSKIHSWEELTDILLAEVAQK